MEERVNCFGHLALFDIQNGGGKNILDCFGIKKEEDTETGNGSELYRPWQDLDHDILLQIFKKDSLHCFIWSAPFVCKSWRYALWDALFWHKHYIDLSDLFLLFQNLDCPIEYPKLEIKLMDTIRSIFEGDGANRTPREGWSQSLISITLPFGFNTSDRICVYIAERTSNLNCFSLGRSEKITREGFSKALVYCRDTSSVKIGPISGRRCRSSRSYVQKLDKV